MQKSMKKWSIFFGCILLFLNNFTSHNGRFSHSSSRNSSSETLDASQLVIVSYRNKPFAQSSASSVNYASAQSPQDESFQSLRFATMSDVDAALVAFQKVHDQANKQSLDRCKNLFDENERQIEKIQNHLRTAQERDRRFVGIESLELRVDDHASRIDYLLQENNTLHCTLAKLSTAISDLSSKFSDMDKNVTVIYQFCRYLERLELKNQLDTINNKIEQTEKNNQQKFRELAIQLQSLLEQHKKNTKTEGSRLEPNNNNEDDDQSPPLSQHSTPPPSYLANKKSNKVRSFVLNHQS